MCFSRYRFADSETCPCGSGLPYKSCCKNRVPDIDPSIQNNPSRVAALASKRLRDALPKCCMHPDKANCKGKVKAAHALQNNKIISLLAGDEHHIYTLAPKDNPLYIGGEWDNLIVLSDIKKVGVNKATTETCFCDYHDSIIFAPIERGAPDFNGSDQHFFLYAYRAFIFEYYKMDASMRIFRSSFKDCPPAFRSSEKVGSYRVLQLQLEECKPIKEFFDHQIITGQTDGLLSIAIEIPKRISFASYSYIAPKFDLNGKRIPKTKHGKMHRIAITIFPEKDKSWILMSCLQSESRYYGQFFSQLQSSELEKIQFYLNYVIPLYSENIILSPSLWCSWSEEKQVLFKYYSNLHGRDFLPVETGIMFTLQNAARKKDSSTYQSQPRINLFS